MIAVNNYEDFGYQNNSFGNDFGFGNNFFGGGGGFTGLTANLFNGGGGGGGGGTDFGTDVPIVIPPIVTTPSNRTFQITSNITGAQIYINGVNSFKTTSENITFTKSELLLIIIPRLVFW